MTEEAEIDARIDSFTLNVARAMSDLKSSHIYFILQQAYPDVADDWEWSDFQKLLDKVIKKWEVNL